MRKAALFYNPLSGRRRGRRLADVEAALAVLRDASVEVTAAPARPASDASGQTRQAIAEGCDTILACGGDGTVHDVLQGVVGSQAALGVIPLGTANCLAHDLGLPFTPVEAARALLRAKPRRIAVGQVEYQNLDGKRGTRYFTVAAGVGVDAHLFYKLNPRVKNSLGMAAYYAKAICLWLTHKMPTFVVEFRETGHQRTWQAQVTELLAVRIRNFGGALRELASGASLDRDDLRLVLFRTSSRLAYLRYIVRGILGAPREISDIELIYSDKVLCHPLSVSGNAHRSRIFVEADGEFLGALPAQISIVPDAVTLLVPTKAE
jgi:YegS/Rv2252/BmrU family lipid kinase